MARALLGTRLRERRVTLGLKQAEAAAAAGISAAYLNLIEHNRRGLGPERLQRLAAVLGLDPAALAEDEAGPLAEGLRAVAAQGAGEGGEAMAAELDRAEEFAGRFPGWAGLILRQHGRIEALRRTVEALNDRLSHDPHLSASLHEVLTAMASVRSVAAILAETPDLEPAWREKFHRNLHEDSERLAKGAEALVDWLDSAGEAAATGALSPQDEVEAWARGRDWALAGAGEDEIAALGSALARALAREWRDLALRDALALPDEVLATALTRHGPDPVRLALDLGSGILPAMRRIALRPGADMGLLVCDASGTPVLRKPVDGFALPRFGAACALWPVFTALARPMQPVEARLETLGAGGRRFLVRAFCEIRLTGGFTGPELRQAAMLILPEPPGSPLPPPDLKVGASCRICPAVACPARREPSILG
jgi:hypothetical protein